jgi:hypothetical protein
MWRKIIARSSESLEGREAQSFGLSHTHQQASSAPWRAFLFETSASRVRSVFFPRVETGFDCTYTPLLSLSSPRQFFSSRSLLCLFGSVSEHMKTAPRRASPALHSLIFIVMLFPLFFTNRLNISSLPRAETRSRAEEREEQKSFRGSVRYIRPQRLCSLVSGISHVKSLARCSLRAGSAQESISRA